MVKLIHGDTVPELYQEVLWALRIEGKREDSRNGPVLAIPNPVVAELTHPTRRVLFSPKRDANPFFHMAEVVWMFAGRDDSEWLSQFNSKYDDYADDGIVNGAYGSRWLGRFNIDQIAMVIRALIRDPNTRRAVIGMWDPNTDLQDYKDVPCNTTIYFRRVNGMLDMTVCNRSNDAIWGMMGTNVVVFTYLHELVAHCSGMTLGRYYVMTNNLHVYTNMPNYERIMSDHSGETMYYNYDWQCPVPLLLDTEAWSDLHLDCLRLCRDMEAGELRTQWARTVAQPMLFYYLSPKPRDASLLNDIAAPDWAAACYDWVDRRGRIE